MSALPDMLPGRGMLVRGAYSDGPPDASASLSLAARDEIRRLGLKLVDQRTSNSGSRYLHVRGGCGNVWVMRISAHALPARASAVHFNLISYDGIFGRDQLIAFIASIAQGRTDWFDPQADWHSISKRLQLRIRRAKRKKGMKS